MCAFYCLETINHLGAVLMPLFYYLFLAFCCIAWFDCSQIQPSARLLTDKGIWHSAPPPQFSNWCCIYFNIKYTSHRLLPHSHLTVESDKHLLYNSVEETVKWSQIVVCICPLNIRLYLISHETVHIRLISLKIIPEDSF